MALEFGEHVGRGAMVRRVALTCGPAWSQHGATALVEAAFGGHTDTVELMLDRGADLEAENWVRAAAVCDAARRAAPGGREVAMAMMRRGVVLVWWAGVGGGAGVEGACR